ncbi:membrane protein insertion efficiency factor YidD [Epidermidibacterium keratini]|uniref:Putative membrane protein insertion efficiency factor n=1 Tax=Epidermidibacterium keratini TaxID=1891644 RepID=A0A7L4YN55_9ACTN|nr:membrane protein insertion efficiency factor YidD [Epidermidibacterium keratini]
MSDPQQTPPPGLPARALLGLVRGYQRWISPLLPPSCRFYPSCSQYAVEAIATHGALRGTGYAAVRLLKCGPWHPGGVDFVKPARPGRRAPRIAPDHGAS